MSDKSEFTNTKDIIDKDMTLNTITINGKLEHLLANFRVIVLLLTRQSFTGQLHLTINFSQGGIGRIEKEIKEELKV